MIMRILQGILHGTAKLASAGLFHMAEIILLATSSSSRI